MCGIVALAHASRPVDARDLGSAVRALHHRGPDGNGTWVSSDRTVGLGHTRLAIIDPATGAQPISNETRDVHLVANGELYDYERIRTDLMARGHRLRTASDSEIALHVYEDEGERFVESLRGQFAIALYDERTKTLIAARDRFGIKPLFYAIREGQLVLASETKALFAAGVERRLGSENVFQALHFAQGPTETLFEGVHQVPPGHLLRFQAGRLSIRPFWELGYPPRRRERTDLSIDEEVQRLGERLEDAVATRTRADVPIGCYLSGGVDSSCVLGMARKLSGRDVEAFSIAFDHPDFDESDVAGEMAAAAGSRFHRIHVTAQDFAGAFDDAVRAGEQIAYNGHVPARFLLSREVQRAGIKTVLGGEGADELFGGYSFASAALGASGTSKVGGGQALGALGAALRFLRSPDRTSGSLGEVSPTLGRLVNAVGFPEGLLAHVTGLLTVYRGLMAPDFLAEHCPRDPYRQLLRGFPKRSFLGRDPYKIVMPLWLKTHFSNYLLGADRLDMAHGVELRLPFLDHLLFEDIRELPSAHLRRNGRNKDLLRRIAEPYVTPRVLEGQKRPFIAPPGTPGDALHAHFESILRDPSFTDVQFFQAGRVAAFLDELPRLPDAERARRMPLVFILASIAVLAQESPAPPSAAPGTRERITPAARAAHWA